MGGCWLPLLACIAEFERELIRIRSSEGRVRARERGVVFGRPPKLGWKERKIILECCRAGESRMEVARRFRDSRSTISRLIGRMEIY
jgi:DNA invertase Pin-like site-specific DNA recombinase